MAGVEHAAHLRRYRRDRRSRESRPCVLGCARFPAARRYCRSANSSVRARPFRDAAAGSNGPLIPTILPEERLFPDELVEATVQHELERPSPGPSTRASRARATPLETAFSPAKRLELESSAPARTHLYARVSAMPASSAVIVPALMSVLSPSIRTQTAPRARDMPPPA